MLKEPSKPSTSKEWSENGQKLLSKDGLKPKNSWNQFLKRLAKSKSRFHKRELIEEYKRECLDKSGVNPDVAEKTNEGAFPNDPLLKEYLFCLSEKLGFQYSNGTVNLDIFVANLWVVTNRDLEVYDSIDNCAVIKSSTPQETAFQVSQCLYDGSPPYIRFNLLNLAIGLLSKEIYEELSKYREECTNETQVQDEFVRDVHFKGKFADDPKFKEYVYCYAKRAGFQNEQGEPQKDIFRSKIAKIISDEALVNKIAVTCFIQKESAQHTAIALFKCITDTSPIKLDLFPKYKLKCGFRKQVRKCYVGTGIDPYLVRMAMRGQIAEDYDLMQFFWCLADEIGAAGKVGKIDFELMRNKTSKLFNDPAIANELAEKCLIEKESGLETIFVAVKCYAANGRGHTDIFQPIPEEVRDRVMIDVKYCSAKFPLPKEILEKARRGDFVDNKQLKEYLFCINKRAGVQYDDREIHFGVLRRNLHHVLLDKETRGVIRLCNIMRNLPEDTAIEMFKCLYRSEPELARVVLEES